MIVPSSLHLFQARTLGEGLLCQPAVLLLLHPLQLLLFMSPAQDHILRCKSGGRQEAPCVPYVINYVFQHSHLQKSPALEYQTLEQLLIKWYFVVLTPFFLMMLLVQGPREKKRCLSGIFLGIRTIIPLRFYP